MDKFAGGVVPAKKVETGRRIAEGERSVPLTENRRYKKQARFRKAR
jgi:hypothetical protein